MAKRNEIYDLSLLIKLIDEKYVLHSRFAKKIGISNSTLSAYLNGYRIITREVMDKFAEALDIKPTQYHTYFFKKQVHEKETQ